MAGPMVWPAGTPVFGFGSNSVRQLRGRLGDQSLMGYPARIRGQVLAFCGPNRSWALEKRPCVGSATLIPAEESIALGTVTFLSDEQIAMLDGFEGVPRIYQQQHFDKEVSEIFGNERWHPLQVMAYVKVDSQDWYPPSEAYCCAILRNLGGSFPGITKLSLRCTGGHLKDEWEHPGFRGLEMAAFLFEVGIRKKRPWVMPRGIGQIRQHVLERKISCPRGVIKEHLGDVMEEEDFTIAKELMERSGTELVEEDDSQAERVPFHLAFL